MVEGLAVLLVAVVALAGLADRVGFPRPVVLLVGGIVLGLVPGVPTMAFDGTVVFAVFFPVLLFAGAYTTSWNDLRPNLGTVFPLALGGVVSTTCAVGLVAHWVVGLPWVVALLLGAVLADPDLGVFTTLVGRLRAAGHRVSRSVRVVLGGEGLFEGAAGLVLYVTLASAVSSGNFSAGDVVVGLVVGPALGVAGGLAVAWVWSEADRRVPDPTISGALSLLAPFAAFLPTEALGGNRIAAVSAAGLFLGWRAHSLLQPSGRLTAAGAWSVLSFLVTGAVYVPAGMALPEVLAQVVDSPGVPGASGVGQVTVLRLVLWTFAITVAVWAARAAVSFTIVALGRVRRHITGLSVTETGTVGTREATWRRGVLGAWAPTRGAFALASALALPVATAGGGPFPARDLMVVLSLTVVLTTTVIQGATLPLVVRMLHDPEEVRDAQEEARAWRVTAEHALSRLDELVAHGEVEDAVAGQLRAQYNDRAHRYRRREAPTQPGEHPSDARSGQEVRAADVATRLDLLGVERGALRAMRDRNEISDSVFRAVLRRLDLIEEYLRG